MRLGKTLAAGVFGMAALSMALAPSTALAQRRGGGQGGGGRGGMAGGGAVEAVNSLELSDDQKAKVKDITQQAMTDFRDQMQNAGQMSPQERQDAMTKFQGELRGKVAEVLTDDQKPKFFNKVATTSVDTAEKQVDAMGKAAAGLDNAGDDKKAQAKTLFEDTTKKLDGFKADAGNAKDETTTADVTKKVADTMGDVRKQVNEILGDDARTVLRAGYTVGGQGRRGGPGGQGGAGGGAAPKATTQPTA